MQFPPDFKQDPQLIRESFLQGKISTGNGWPMFSDFSISDFDRPLLNFDLSPAIKLITATLNTLKMTDHFFWGGD